MGVRAVFSRVTVRRRSAAAQDGNRRCFVAWPPLSQLFRPAQGCLLSPLSMVPWGMALSPAMRFREAQRWAVLETLLSLWCW